MAVKLPEGYGCDVFNSPQQYEVQCPICLQVFRDACCVSCCGQYFCRECIEYVRRKRKRCPLCNNEDFTVRDGEAKEESLRGLRFRCSHRRSGCEWTGELRNYEPHLNADATPSRALSGCEYVKLPCADCGEVCVRFCMPSHAEFCPQRQYTCPYCRNWSATYQEVVEEHWPNCELYPVLCLNECGAKPSRRNMEVHLSEYCPLTVTLRNSASIEGLDVDKPGTSGSGSAALAPAAVDWPKRLKPDLFSKCLTFKHFSQHVNTGKPWFSRPFDSQGYRMCISAVVKSSVFIPTAHIMRGEFDDHLRWPFRGVIEIHIVDRCFRDFISLEVHYNTDTPLSAAQRVFDGEIGVGWGCSQSVPLKTLSPRYLLRGSPQYVANDSLLLSICVTVMSSSC